MADFQRQLDIIDPKKLVYPVTCIGLGGIGSFAALTLRKMGFHTFVLWDHDFVEPHNVPSQAYGKADIESAKTEALAAHLEACLNERLETNVYTRRADEFDSFEGIPEHREAHGKNIYGGDAYFPPGSYRGSLEEVQKTIGTFGDRTPCGHRRDSRYCRAFSLSGNISKS